MAEEIVLQRTKEIFDALCARFDAEGWSYEADASNYAVYSDLEGSDIPIKVKVVLEPERQLILLFSPLPFEIPEDMRVVVALAVDKINDRLVDGNFDYDFVTGTLGFRIAVSYLDSTVSKNLFDYLLYVSYNTIDRYDDKLLWIIKGKMTLQQLDEFMGN